MQGCSVRRLGRSRDTKLAAPIKELEDRITWAIAGDDHLSQTAIPLRFIPQGSARLSAESGVIQAAVSLCSVCEVPGQAGQSAAGGVRPSRSAWGLSAGMIEG
jgi:hypothetical protein